MVRLFRWMLLILSVLLLQACSSNVSAPVVNRTAATSYKPVYHVVKRNETLYSVAFQYGLDYRSLAKWNYITRPYTIYVGQKIFLNRASAAKYAKKPEKTVSNKKILEPSTAVSSTKQAKVKPKSAVKTGNGGEDLAGPVRWQWPATGKVVRGFSTRSPGNKGIDIAGRYRQPIFAAASGKIVYSGNGLLGYGNLVIVKHSQGYLSAYAHNHRILVKEGDHVRIGHQIAEMGIRNEEKRSLLHFEIRKDGVPVNPLRYLPKR